jgi:hypothetical protein
MNSKRMREYAEVVMDHIDRIGWSLAGVFDPEGSDPCFTYSIGLEHSFEHPELICVGLPNHQAALVMNRIGELVRNGRFFKVGEVVSGDDIDFTLDFAIGSVSDAEKTKRMTGSKSLNGKDFRALQVLWPDTQGRLPGHPDYEERFAKLQPLLHV